MKTAYIFRYEWLHFRRNAYKVAALFLFLLTALYGLWNGYNLWQERQSEIEKIEADARGSREEALEWLHAGKPGPEDRPWVNITEPFWAMWYAMHHAYQHPSPLMTYSIGQAEQFGYYKRVSMWSTPYDGDLAAELSNPERVAIGALDFSFVWLFLMPLFLIILTYGVNGLEQDLGFSELLAVQQPSRSRWIAGRLLASGGLLTGLLAAFIAAPALWGGYLFDHFAALSLLFAHAFAYLLLWLLLFGLIIYYGKGQTDQALKMIGLWLLLAVVIPGAVQQITALRYPASYFLEFIDAQREDRDAIFDRDFSVIKAELFDRYPELQHTYWARQDSVGNQDARNSAYRMAYMLHMNEVSTQIQAEQEARNAFIRATYLFNPVTAFQNRINAVAETDFYANLAFRKTIQQAATDINEKLLMDDWDGVKADAVMFEKYAQIVGR